MRVLWLTNDLPPRAGGIEQFVANLARRVHPHSTVVIGPREQGSAQWDAAEDFDVVRLPYSTVLPVPSVLRRVRAVARAQRPDVIVLGASWPLGELAPALRADPGVPVVALTHGLEAGLARVGLGFLVGRATRGCDAVTTISDFTAARLQPHLRAARVERVPPGVDVQAFRPGTDAAPLRREWGVPLGAPLVGCVSRLVARKGQARLLDAWPALQRRHPDAWLVLVGGGPQLERVRRAAARHEQVVVPGPVDWPRLPAAHGALDVFAMPCRTRWLGLDVEGLGIVFLEAQASGVPVVAGDSGGAAEAVRHGTTGFVVDGDDPAGIASALHELLRDAQLRRSFGRAGRAWAEEVWSWESIASRFARVLDEVTGQTPSGVSARDPR